MQNTAPEIHTGRRIYWTATGTDDSGVINEEGRYLPNGDEHPDGELFFHVTFDDGFTDWCHQSLVTLS
jgi:hypothetical protein